MVLMTKAKVADLLIKLIWRKSSRSSKLVQCTVAAAPPLCRRPRPRFSTSCCTPRLDLGWSLADVTRVWKKGFFGMDEMLFRSVGNIHSCSCHSTWNWRPYVLSVVLAIRPAPPLSAFLFTPCSTKTFESARERRRRRNNEDQRKRLR